MPAARSLALLLLALVACDKKSAPKPVEGSGSQVVVTADAARAAADAAGLAAVADAGVEDAAVTLGVPIDAPQVACETAAINAARKQGEAHMKAGGYDAAIAALQPGACFLDRDQPPALQKAIAWRLSDLSFAYYKTGAYENCYAIASAEQHPYIGNIGSVFDDDDPIMSALAYNEKLCQNAAAKERGKFEPAGKCALVEDAHAVPASALDATDKAACLVIEAGKQDADELHECGAVVLVRQPKQGKLSRTKIANVDGNLANGSVCCNVQRVSFGRRAGNLAVLVETMGRDCNGGTASSEEQHAFELKGDSLELYHALAAIAH